MKKRIQLRRKTKAFTITVPMDLLPQIENRALAVSRNRSSYISWLIAQDIQAANK